MWIYMQSGDKYKVGYLIAERFHEVDTYEDDPPLTEEESIVELHYYRRIPQKARSKARQAVHYLNGGN